MLHRSVWDAPSASLKKKLVSNQEKGQKVLHRTVWDAQSASSKQKLVLDQEKENYFLTDSFKKACDRLALQKMTTVVSVESRAQNQASCLLKINSRLGSKPVENQKIIFGSIEKFWLSAQNT